MAHASSPTTYAQAVIGILSIGGTVDSVVPDLMAHLKAHGLLKLLPQILAEVKRLQERPVSRPPVVEIATGMDATAALAEARALGVEASETVINDSLISGWRALDRNTLIDRSGKRFLIEVYAGATT